MRILFICGCLEPGKDGVGDYTRRLAEASIGQEHEVFLISLQDKYVVSNDFVANVQNGVAVQIQTARLSANIMWSERIKIINRIIEDYKPNWISLQYVPYSFNKKG